MNSFYSSQADRIANLTKDGATVEVHAKHPIKTIVQPYGNRGRATIFLGETAKPVADFAFASIEKARAYADAEVERLAQSYEAKEAAKAERRAKLAAVKASNFFKVGDIVYASWGYEQTNVDFYQIVAVTDKSVKFREVNASSTESGFMSGNCVALKDQFSDEEVHTRKVNAYGSIAFGHKSLSRWDGKPLHYSCYA